MDDKHRTLLSPTLFKKVKTNINSIEALLGSFLDCSICLKATHDSGITTCGHSCFVGHAFINKLKVFSGFSLYTDVNI